MPLRRDFRSSSPITSAAFGDAESLLPVAQTVLGLGALYVIMSASEYMYHRYFQHLGINKVDAFRNLRTALNMPTYKGDGHVEHHRETLDDMTLDRRLDEVLDADPYRGTAFNWLTTFLMTTPVMGMGYPILSLIGWPGPAIVVAVIGAIMIHALIWNSLHPHMHGLPEVPASHGVPSSVLAPFRDSALFVWLRENHEGHHRVPGAQGNYNVCMPLMDQVFGTDIGRIPPQPVVAKA